MFLEIWSFIMFLIDSFSNDNIIGSRGELFKSIFNKNFAEPGVDALTCNAKKRTILNYSYMQLN